MLDIDLLRWSSWRWIEAFRLTNQEINNWTSQELLNSCRNYALWFLQQESARSSTVKNGIRAENHVFMLLFPASGQRTLVVRKRSSKIVGLTHIYFFTWRAWNGIFQLVLAWRGVGLRVKQSCISITAIPINFYYTAKIERNLYVDSCWCITIRDE